MLGNESFDWNKENVRSLRLRLGWSKSDLARRLNCSAAEVEAWEDGSAPLTSAVKSELAMIARQADECSDEVRCVPAAENECDKNALAQVDFSRIKADLN